MRTNGMASADFSPARSSLRRWPLALLVTALAFALLWAALTPRVGRAQETVGVYTVVPGDTLSAIAARFEVPLDAIIQLNNITDPALIQVGQELLIPGQSALLTLGVAETAPVYARQGETLATLATRTGQDGALVAALNGMTLTTRLWPGQPVAIPAAGTDSAPLRFGAIDRVALTPQILQGRTGRIKIGVQRPLSLSVDWNGLAVPVVAEAEPSGTVEALLPAPALIEPGIYTVTVVYTTTSGVPVSRTWPVEIADGGYAFQNIYVPPEKSDTLDATVIATETELMRAVYAPVTTALTWRDPFARPIGPEFATTSPFGTRRSYNDGLLGGFHSGQDYGAPEGTPVLAPAAGTVSLARFLPIRGNAVVLDHGRGVYTGYWHLSQLSVAPGQEVNQGDVIGLVGNTGRSTGAHLHWELRIDGIAVDPLQFLEEPLFGSLE